MGSDLLNWFIPEALGSGTTAMLIVASFFTSGLTAAFGIGGGVALLAILLNVLPPAIVLPVHGIVQTGSNLGRAVIMRRQIRMGIVRWFAVGTVIGIVLASLVFVALPTAVLQLILALFILWVLWAPGLSKKDIEDRGFLLVGAGAAFCTMFIGASGVLVGAFWSVARLTKQGVVATHAACISIQHGLKVVAFGFLGFAFHDWIGLVVAMVASGFIGTLLGKHVLTRLPEHLFAQLFKLTLTVLALRLLWNALRGLI